MYNIPELLSNISRVGNADFFINIEARKIEYKDILSDYTQTIDSDLLQTVFHLENRQNNSYTQVVQEDGIYILECYDELEKQLKQKVDKEIYAVLNLEQRALYITPIIAQLDHIANKLKRFKLDKKLDEFRLSIIARLQDCILVLQKSYLNSVPKMDKVPSGKIKWLGVTKALTTLFLDLLEGQKKIKGPATRPMLHASYADIQRLILNNFVDSEGKPFKIETIKSYVNTTKQDSRIMPGDGGRIEIEML